MLALLRFESRAKPNVVVVVVVVVDEAVVIEVSWMVVVWLS